MKKDKLTFKILALFILGMFLLIYIIAIMESIEPTWFEAHQRFIHELKDLFGL